MKKELKEKFDKMDFVKNPSGDIYESCIGDDTDSWFSTYLYNYVSDVEIGGFYNFKSLYFSESRENKKFVGMDMSLIKDGFRCFDNHVNLQAHDSEKNNLCANLNVFNGISLENYHDKFAGSTFMQMYAYYMDGMKPPTLEGGLILACIDVAFKGHYSSDYKKVHNAYLEDLGFTWMIDLLNKYSITEMYQFLLAHGLDSKLERNRITGKLENVRPWEKVNGQWQRKAGNLLDSGFVEKNIGFPVILPEEKFINEQKFKRHSNNISKVNLEKLDKNNILSMAFTYQNTIEYTLIK